MVATAEHDVIDQLAGIAEDSPVAALRQQKPDLVTFAQGSYNALLEPPEPGNVSLLERHAVAYRVGLLTGFDTVAIHHRDRLRSLGASDELIAAIASFSNGEALDGRLAALLAHADRVTKAPGTAEAGHIVALEAAGSTPTEIVTVAQLIGFLTYEIRAIAVARAMEKNDDQHTDSRCALDCAVGLAALDRTIAEIDGSPEQWSVLDEVVPAMKKNPYYLLLAHDPEPLPPAHRAVQWHHQRRGWVGPVRPRTGRRRHLAGQWLRLLRRACQGLQPIHRRHRTD